MYIFAISSVTKLLNDSNNHINTFLVVARNKGEAMGTANDEIDRIFGKAMIQNINFNFKDVSVDEFLKGLEQYNNGVDISTVVKEDKLEITDDDYILNKSTFSKSRWAKIEKIIADETQHKFKKFIK